MSDDDDWLVRTKLEAPRTEGLAPADAIPTEVSGTYWIVATDDEASALFVRKNVETRNPFTGTFAQMELLVIDGAALERLPHVRQRASEDDGSAGVAAELLDGIGCDLDVPALANATQQIRVYEVRDAAKLAGGELDALARAAMGGRGKLWAFLDDLADDD